MRAFKRNVRICALVCLATLCVTAVPGPLLADDKNNSDGTAKAAPVKIDAPAPGLTERERWLLDRVEQLEKRVAELETKSQPAGAPAAEAAASPAPGTPAPAAVAAASPAASAAPASSGSASSSGTVSNPARAKAI
jgi:hypothetical protein